MQVRYLRSRTHIFRGNLNGNSELLDKVCTRVQVTWFRRLTYVLCGDLNDDFIDPEAARIAEDCGSRRIRPFISTLEQQELLRIAPTDTPDCSLVDGCWRVCNIRVKFKARYPR